MGTIYWQVAAGDGNRDYSKVFLNFGVMLIGPGDPGAYFENQNYYDIDYGNSDVSKFANEVKEGDIVALKRPSGQSWEIIAAGRVKDKYRHFTVFDDVEGWDLQHCRFVDWKIPEQKVTTTGLTRGTFLKVHQTIPQKKINRILKYGNSNNFDKIPTPPRKLTDEDLIELLINSGLRIRDAEKFTSTINQIRRLTRWYYKNGVDISEYETRSFLIIPLILTLGWTEQQLKIEWKNIDIAFFRIPYTNQSHNPDDCVIILESKRLWEGLTFGTKQARRYSYDFKNCNHFIVSDGCCYKLFTKDKKQWKYRAYLNILKPKQNHSYETHVRGAQDVFLSLINR